MCISKHAHKLPQLTMVLHSLTALCCAALPCAGDAWQPYGPPAALVIPPYADQPYPDAHTPYNKEGCCAFNSPARQYQT
jgi:hypothetical protein